MTIERPMFPPVDPTRRHLLTIAAGAAVAAAIPTVAGIPTAVAADPDPIYAAIEAHRKARAASCAASAEVRRLCDLADEIAGPREIDIPSMIEPGTTVRASIWLDIEGAIPSAQFPEQYAHYLALLEERAPLTSLSRAIQTQSATRSMRPNGTHWASLPIPCRPRLPACGQ